LVLDELKRVFDRVDSEEQEY